MTSPYKLDVLAILDNPVISGGAYFIIALGAFIFVVAFLGCCGAWMENRLMLVIVSTAPAVDDFFFDVFINVITVCD